MTTKLAAAFSSRQAPGQPAASCAATPAAAPAARVPCNLRSLLTTRVKTGDEHHERVDVMLEPGAAPNLLACPVQLPAQEPLELIAPTAGRRTPGQGRAGVHRGIVLHTWALCTVAGAGDGIRLQFNTAPFRLTAWCQLNGEPAPPANPQRTRTRTPP